MSKVMNGRWLTATMSLTAGLVVGCSESPTEAPLRSQITRQAALIATPEAQQNGRVCVAGPAGNYTMSISMADPDNIGTLLVGPSFNLSADNCVTVVQTDAGDRNIDLLVHVTIGNTGTPSDVGLDNVQRTQWVYKRQTSNELHSTTITTETGPSVQFHLGLERSAEVLFNFSPRSSGAGQGCTPGYWKQSQHFGNWTTPYTPSTLFSAVFENAFPGMTLLDVLGQGGGGLKALGRHTVAALLNGASANVSSDMTAQEVINAFNAAFPGGDYEGQKNIFEGFNEQGCPLGRNP